MAPFKTCIWWFHLTLAPHSTELFGYYSPPFTITYSPSEICLKVAGNQDEPTGIISNIRLYCHCPNPSSLQQSVSFLSKCAFIPKDVVAASTSASSQQPPSAVRHLHCWEGSSSGIFCMTSTWLCSGGDNQNEVIINKTRLHCFHPSPHCSHCAYHWSCSEIHFDPNKLHVWELIPPSFPLLPHTPVTQLSCETVASHLHPDAVVFAKFSNLEPIFVLHWFHAVQVQTD